MEDDTRARRGSGFVAFLASPRTRAVALVVLLVGLGIGVYVVGAPSQQEVRSVVERSGVAAPVVFVLLYVVFTVLLVPGAIVTIAGGVLFGTWLGTALALVGASLGAVAAFLIARRLGREQVARIAGERMGRLDDWLERRGLLAFLYLRLIPVVPFNVLNYVAGVTGSRFRDYTIGTVVGIVPGTFAYAALGGNFDDPTQPEFLAAVGLIVVLAVGGPLLNRWLRARGRDAPPTDDDVTRREEHV